MVRISLFTRLGSALSNLVFSAARIARRTEFRNALIHKPRLNRSGSYGSFLESLEPRHLMAAVPIANNDSAFYTSISTDLVVSTSSIPAHLLANDLDIDGGAITTSVVANPTSGTLIAFGTNGTTIVSGTGDASMTARNETESEEL